MGLGLPDAGSAQPHGVGVGLREETRRNGPCGYGRCGRLGWLRLCVRLSGAYFHNGEPYGIYDRQQASVD